MMMKLISMDSNGYTSKDHLSQENNETEHFFHFESRVFVCLTTINVKC